MKVGMVTMGLAVVAVAGLLAGCVAKPFPIVTTGNGISERIMIEQTRDGYQLTFSTPNGEVTRRIWCDSFDSRCIEAK